MNLEELREITLKEIEGLPNDYRCHEVARIVWNKLKSLAINVSVKDGLVVYDIFSLLRDSLFRNFFSTGFFDGFTKEVEREILEGRRKQKLRVFHSWCEVTENQDDVIVIDWHARLKLSQGETLENILIAEKKKNLPHRYNPVGIMLGNWIVLKKFPPIATKLRL